MEILSANFLVLLSEYLNERFGKEYCLNPQASLSFQVGSLTIPAQIIIAIWKFCRMRPVVGLVIRLQLMAI